VETIRPDGFLRVLDLLLVEMLACGPQLEVVVVRRRICEVVKTFSFDVIHGFYDSDFDTGIDTWFFYDLGCLSAMVFMFMIMIMLIPMQLTCLL
jgi:hypothetical protein